MVEKRYRVRQIIMCRHGRAFSRVAVVESFDDGILWVRKYSATGNRFESQVRVPAHDARPLARDEQGAELVKRARQRLGKEQAESNGPRAQGADR